MSSYASSFLSEKIGNKKRCLRSLGLDKKGLYVLPYFGDTI
jgi:hypothetical protein